MSNAVLQSYVERQPDGATLDWTGVEQATGVVMDSKGKAQLRAAIKACRRVAVSIRGTGVRLSAAETAYDITLDVGLRRIKGAADRAASMHSSLVERHMPAMPPEERDNMIRYSAFLGAIRGTVGDARKALPPPVVKELPKPDASALKGNGG